MKLDTRLDLKVTPKTKKEVKLFDQIHTFLEKKFGVSTKYKPITKGMTIWASSNGLFFRIKGKNITIDKKERLSNKHFTYSKALIIAKLFCPKEPLKKQITFIDGDPKNLSADNLKWWYKSKWYKENIFKKQIRTIKPKVRRFLIENHLKNNRYQFMVFTIESLDRDIYIGYARAEDVMNRDIIKLMSAKNSWVRKYFEEEGPSYFKLRVLSIHSTRSEVKEMIPLYWCLYESKGMRVVNMDYKTSQSEHIFLHRLTKEQIKENDIQSNLKIGKRELRDWLLKKREFFKEFDRDIPAIMITKPKI